jgi:hypothetical protein
LKSKFRPASPSPLPSTQAPIRTMSTSPVSSTRVSTMFVRIEAVMPRKLTSATMTMKTSAESVVGRSTNSFR